MERVLLFKWIGLFVFLIFLVFLVYKIRKRSRVKFLETYIFHSKIKDKIKTVYPHLSSQELDIVLKALREYFCVCQVAGKKMVSMPSQVVDVAWHEFILYTRSYQKFCKKAFGRFLHHTPAEAMPTPNSAQEGIKRVWRISCFREGANPKSPGHLPLLFAIDQKLNIKDGFQYSLNCRRSSSSGGTSDYCASHISCASGCSGDSGDSESSSSFGGFFDSFSSDSSGCSGGCGGGGD
ncbi:glycine-rich domain-containing protein [Microbulbifer sp. CnH-101-G]|uniref:glycine-rich domain-containing protein n=1 Tax=Microbulbifer sp. CnH-101-G TaxID=3243393 RepID=UPI0040392A9F